LPGSSPAKRRQPRQASLPEEKAKASFRSPKVVSGTPYTTLDFPVATWDRRAPARQKRRVSCIPGLSPLANIHRPVRAKAKAYPERCRFAREFRGLHTHNLGNVRGQIFIIKFISSGEKEPVKRACRQRNLEACFRIPTEAGAVERRPTLLSANGWATR